MSEGAESHAALDTMARISDGLLRRTGHHYYSDKAHILEERVRERMRQRGFSSLRAYHELLEHETRGEAEWRALEDAVTIGETYFFRYAEQFEELRTDILPRLIAARSESRTLRIWSIGCSNGAEPYTIAIVLREVMGAMADDWRISITGGDISEAALKRAASGRFGPWALRALPEATIERYFDRQGPRTWLLKRPYRSMVRFERQNLLDLLSPAAPLQWSGFDVIFCRNVLIYFSPEDAVRLAGELRARLAPGGCLVLGHAEAGLTVPLASLPEGGLASEFQAALAPAPAPAAVAGTVASPVGMDASGSPIFMASGSAPLKFPEEIPPTTAPAPVQNELALLKRLADEGDYRAAEEVASRLAGRPDAPPEVFYLRSVLRQVEDDLDGAEKALRQAIYLDRSFVLAHHRLGLIALSRGRSADGRKSLRTAVRLASQLQPDAELAGGDGIRAGEFVSMASGRMTSETGT